VATVNVYSKPNITLTGITSPLNVGTPVNFTVNSDSENFSFINENGTFIYDSAVMSLGNISYLANTITGVLTPLIAGSDFSFKWVSSQKWIGIDSNTVTFDIEDNSEPSRDAEVGFGLGIINGVQQTDCIIAGQTGAGQTSLVYGPAIPGSGTPLIKLLFQEDFIAGSTNLTALISRISSTYLVEAVNKDTQVRYPGGVGSGGSVGSNYFRINCVGTPVPYNYINDACTLARTAGPFLEIAKSGSTNPLPVGTYQLFLTRKDTNVIANNPFEFTVTVNP